MKKTTRWLLCLVLVFALTAALSLAACQPEGESTTYTLTFATGDHAATGATAPTALSLAKDAATYLPAAPNAADNWEFDGWSDGTTKYAAGAKYTMPGADTTLTAQWKSATPAAPTTYTLTFALGDHAATGSTAPAAQTLSAGAKYTLPDAPTAAEDWVFTGWNDGDNTYAAKAKYTMPSANATLTAQWKQVEPDAPFTTEPFDAYAAFTWGDNKTGVAVFKSGTTTFELSTSTGTEEVEAATFEAHYDYETSYELKEYFYYTISEDGQIAVYSRNESTYSLAEGVSVSIDGNTLNVSIQRDDYEYTYYEMGTGYVEGTIDVDLNVSLPLYTLAVSGSNSVAGDYWLSEGTSIYNFWWDICDGLTAPEYVFNGKSVDLDEYADTPATDAMPAQDSTLEAKGLHTLTIATDAHCSLPDPDYATWEIATGDSFPSDLLMMIAYGGLDTDEGWELASISDGITTYNFDDGENSIDDWTMPDSDATLTLQCEKHKNKYSISYEIDTRRLNADWWTANQSEFAPVEKYAGDNFTLSEEDFFEAIDTACRGQYVAGWLYDGVIYLPGDEFTVPEENVTFVAQFESSPFLSDDFTEEAFDGYIEIQDDTGSYWYGLSFTKEGSVNIAAVGDSAEAAPALGGDGTYTVSGGLITVTLTGKGTLVLLIRGNNLTCIGKLTAGEDSLVFNDNSIYVYKLVDETDDSKTQWVVEGVQLFAGEEGKIVEENGVDKGDATQYRTPFKDCKIKLVAAKKIDLSKYAGEWKSNQTLFIDSADRGAFKIENNQLIFAADGGSFDGDTYTPEITVSEDGGKVVVKFHSGIYYFTLTFTSDEEATLDNETDTITFTLQKTA